MKSEKIYQLSSLAAKVDGLYDCFVYGMRDFLGEAFDVQSKYEIKFADDMEDIDDPLYGDFTIRVWTRHGEKDFYIKSVEKNGKDYKLNGSFEGEYPKTEEITIYGPITNAERESIYEFVKYAVNQ